MDKPEAQEGSKVPWKKFLAIGCAVFFLCGLGFAGCVGSIFYGVVSVIKGSEPYQMATKLAKESPKIEQAIGEVTGFGFMPSGKVNMSGSTGTADLSIGVNGKSGSGTLYFVAIRREGTWKTTSAVFKTGEQRIVIIGN